MSVFRYLDEQGEETHTALQGLFLALGLERVFGLDPEKFLPEAFTSDPERMARFERDARSFASRWKRATRSASLANS